MVLAGLLVALVAIIDDAIVDIENIVRRLRQNRGQENPKSTAAVILDASLETRSPLLYATLIALLAVIPVLFIGGIAGAFYQPLVVSYALAILASMAVALAIVPALAFVLMSGKAAERREPALVRVLQNRYEGLLGRLLGAPAMTLAVAALIAIMGLAVWPRLQWSQLPAFKERDLLVTWEAAPGTSQAEMQRITARASNELRTVPGVKSVGVHVGRAITGDQVVGLNSSQLWVSLDRKAAYDPTVAAIQQVVDGYPGVHARVQSYLRKTLGEVLTGAPHPIVVRIYGAERDILRRKAEEVRQVLSRIGGVVDPRVENETEEPHIQVKVDVNAAGQLGLKPGDVRRSAATVFSGIEVGYLFEEQKVFEVVVWSAPEKRHSVDSIRNLLVETPSGDHVRLAGIADVGIKPTPAVIQREAISNYVDVVAGLQGPDLAGVSREIERRLQEVRFPLEYHPEMLGEYSERQSAQWRALIVAAIAALGIFLLLQACFESWLLAAVLIAALPAALIGGVLAAYAAGGTLTIGSLAGLLAVLAVTARSSILLIRHYQHLEQQENQPFGLALMMRGARERLAPTLASAICIAMALAPLVALGDLAGFEVARPLAVVVLGGLVSSTLLVLVIVPVLYWCFGHSRDLQLERVSS
jgi:Cu/Ag efflux pump CusA